MNTRTLIEKLVEALEIEMQFGCCAYYVSKREDAITAAREWRAAPESEPFAWAYSERGGKPIINQNPPSNYAPNELSENEVTVTELFTHPAPSKPAPLPELTDADLLPIYQKYGTGRLDGFMAAAKAVLEAAREKANG